LSCLVFNIPRYRSPCSWCGFYFFDSSQIFVAATNKQRVAGYYTLASTGILLKAAVAFYVQHGFCPLAATPLTLFLPLAAARTLL
jgi:hypothetical protein